ncbi:indole-3-glycerol phosphate synthase TrpC [Peribacillus sp. B-H-3]|jgi:indole-3-glycerol phosphate synthase|uniref:indole-3-glycerol phosphate synthase TrpC n=1 Tax=Peribacillus sp. B-H-3 TaxID=3400420 RepID=UPI003B028775
MENILLKIIEQKKIEVALLKQSGIVYQIDEKPENKSLIKRLQSSQTVSIIAEIKRASPSKGDIKSDANPAEQAKKYERYGASAISVLTDPTFFKGSIEDLKNVRAAVQVPVLCKDFIIDEIQIDRAKAAGANLILLIAAALPIERLKELYLYAKSKNLEVLTEVHDEEELERAMLIDPELIGINNRNLKTFQVDLGITEKLAKELSSSGKIIISESGIKSEDDVKRVKEAGAKGILVGETLMKSGDLKNIMSSFQVSF